MKLPMEMTRIENHITSLFSLSRKNPVTGKVEPHNGLDLARAPLRKGSPVYAVWDGVVITANQDPGSSAGKFIRLNHGAYHTRYLHLDTVVVKVGEIVKEGQLIGTMGMTGQSTGPHLHFEIRNTDDKPVDPLPFLTGKQLMGPRIMVNDKYVFIATKLILNKTCVQARTSNNSTSWVQVRFLEELLGAPLEWDQATITAKFNLNS